MALSDFLSAIRELVLDRGVDFETQSDRRAALEERFPRLSAEQLDDLAAISPNRLHTYTDLVFAGERSTLEWVFPTSLAVIGRLRAAAGDDRPPRLADFELVRELHQFRPWASSSQRQLAADFDVFLRANHSAWFEAWPGLGELLDFERLELEVFYAEDLPHTRFTPSVSDALVSLSVESLMERRITLPPYVGVRSFRYDILGLVGEFRESGDLPDPLPKPAGCRIVCGRSAHSLLPVWTRLDDSEYTSILQLPSGEGVEINELATAFLEAQTVDGALDEQAVFTSFFQSLTRLLETGVLLLCPMDHDLPCKAP